MIIHLPPGPLDCSSRAPLAHTNLAPLALTSNTTVVQLHYRLSNSYRYPTPIHDVLAGYDWVVEHLLKAERAARGPGRGRIAVCGELLGGSLAAMLALTECRALDPHGVCAAVLGNPVADWTAMHNLPPTNSDPAAARTAELTSTGKAKKKKPGPKDSWAEASSTNVVSPSSLLKSRGAFFRTPADYFDPFASPLLLFRTPSTEIPPTIDPLDELFAELDGIVRLVEKKRKSYRRYPGAGQKLRLPDTRVWVGRENALRDMGVELGKAMQKAGEAGRKEGEDGGRVSVEGIEGEGLWGEDQVLEMGSWFGHVLWSKDGG